MATIIDNYLDREIGRLITKKNEESQKAHKSSGKLSASQLGNPLQWQILKSLGVEEAKKDEYTLRKFKRGNDVEEWYLSAVPGVVERQAFLEYRDVRGYPAAIVDTSKWDFPTNEKPPLEVKSTSNANFKWILKDGPKMGHCLQGTLYAVAKGVKKFPLSYIATDDYRVQTYWIAVKDYQKRMDAIIDRYEAQKATGLVPVFVSEEKWQENQKYNPYPEWATLTQEDINKKIASLKSG